MSGRLATELPIEWRPFIEALQPFYVRVNEDVTLLSSGYYPGSAAIYALFESIASGSLANA